MLFDTHAHLDFPELAGDLENVVARAEAAGISRIITIGTTIEGSRRAVAIAEQFPQVFAAVGIHPNAAAEVGDDFLPQLRHLAAHPKVVAIGETGLDYHRLPDATAPVSPEGEPENPSRTSAKAAQAAVFAQQLDLAAELGLNVIIHERDAWDDTLAMLLPYSGKLRAVFHCFGKSPAHAAKLVEHGHMVSFTGIVTFKNAAEAQQTARQVPGDAFMFETDCPFLAPVPFRGKRGEPAFTRQIAEHVAGLRGETLSTLAATTSANAARFFRFPH